MRKIDLQQVVADAKLGRLHYVVLFWCALVIVFDGYDLAIVGIALPAIMGEMAVNPAKAGFMVSSALFGMTFGNILLGSVSDRIGRRRTTALCVVLFSVFTVAAGIARNPVEFGLARFVAGIGIGGVMPNVIAQMTEYAPRRLRGTLVALMFSGYSLGGMLAALLGKTMIDSYGWRSVFIAAGLPLLFVPLLLRGMPESMSFLSGKGMERALADIARRIDPELKIGSGDRLLWHRHDETGRAPLKLLLGDGRGPSTIMFWIACFICLFMVYALSSWLVKLMASAGYGMGSAMTVILVLNLGAVVGAVGGGWIADRLHIKRVLMTMFSLASVAIILLSHPLPTPVTLLLAALAGACTIGTQILLCAYAGQFYPGEIRSTGVGWVLGVGRIGAILAPIFIGLLVDMQLPIDWNFLAIGLPAVLAAMAVRFIDDGRSTAFRSEPPRPEGDVRSISRS
ncbi:MFS transporter [Burkholderia sp. HI2500]|uniref:MFS transporter n=1 Tax=Burkholderia sp. HI2500 TaxID=2015358 RepID=UPI000B7AB713|nr:aromatic acid/H+ symport family MFS transporter [Burkholderia sp. HI2500]OXJ09241.1 MFS transporter [Burkholderia sp. HI2500]